MQSIKALLRYMTFAISIVTAMPAIADDYTARRDRNEEIAQDVVGPSFTVTRRDNGNGPSSSPHADGRAFDYVSNATTFAERNDEAAHVSAKLPQDSTVVVETPLYGPLADQHDVYKNGQHAKTTFEEPKATGKHTHVQVDIAR